MTNVVNLKEAASGIKADKFMELSALECLFDSVLDNELMGLSHLEQDIDSLNKSINNASKLSRRMDFERELNKKYKAYSMELAKLAVKVDKHFTNRLELMRGL